jgi:selenocysteine-specific translation elongation factor
MHIVALAGVDAHSTKVIGTELSGAKPDHVAGSDYLISEATAEKTAFTLITLPSAENGLAAMLTGGLLSDTVIVVLSAAGWEEHQARLTDTLHVIGTHSVIVAIDAPDHSESLTHAIRQQLGSNEIIQSAVVNIDTQKADVAELRTTLETMLASTPEISYAGPTRFWPEKVTRKDKGGTVVVGFVTGAPLKIGDTLRTLENREVTVKGLQKISSRVESVEPGTYVAMGIGDVDLKHIGLGTFLIDSKASSWNNSADCVVTVRRTSKEDLHATQTYSAQIGNFTCYASLQTLEGTSLSPGQSGAVRIRLSRSLPMFVHDRIALKNFETGEFVAAGEVSETALALDAIELDDVDALLRTRGWIEIDEFERLSGQKRPPTIGHWIVDISALEEASGRLRQMITQAGTAGIDITSLTEKELAVLRTLAGIEVINGRAFAAGVEHDFNARAARSSALQL